MFIIACNKCPFHKETPAQGANDHTCELKGTYLFVDLKKQEVDKDCPLRDRNFTFSLAMNRRNE